MATKPWTVTQEVWARERGRTQRSDSMGISWGNNNIFLFMYFTYALLLSEHPNINYTLRDKKSGTELFLAM